jgi:hypothetical protein
MFAGMSGIGETSGIAVDTEIVVLWTLRNGRAIREEAYMSPEEALEAVGLERRSRPSGSLP